MNKRFNDFLMEQFGEDTGCIAVSNGSLDLRYVYWLESQLDSIKPNELSIVDNHESIKSSVSAVDKCIVVTSSVGLCMKVVDDKSIKVFNKKS